MTRPFVDPAWLADHPEAVLVDVRWYADRTPGRPAFERGHLPGAVFLELEDVLADPASVEGGRHPLPSPERFAEGLSALGIGDDDLVVAYDDDSGAMAARLVWLLRVTGHEAALLEGGLVGWKGHRETGPGTPRPRALFTPRPWPADLLVEADELAGQVLLDARPGPRFHGENEVLDARPGHVPGALSVPCRDNVGPDGRLLPVPVLRERLASLEPGWVSMCGSGVTACHTLLVAEQLGLPEGRLYPGSWSQWAATDRPAEL